MQIAELWEVFTIYITMRKTTSKRTYEGENYCVCGC